MPNTEPDEFTLTPAKLAEIVRDAIQNDVQDLLEEEPDRLREPDADPGEQGAWGVWFEPLDAHEDDTVPAGSYGLVITRDAGTSLNPQPRRMARVVVTPLDDEPDETD